MPALLSDAANERFILRKHCEAVGSFVPEICRQKSAFPGPSMDTVSEEEPRDGSFWRPARKTRNFAPAHVARIRSFPRVFGCRPPLHRGTAIDVTFLKGTPHHLLRRHLPTAVGRLLVSYRGGAMSPKSLPPLGEGDLREAQDGRGRRPYFIPRTPTGRG